MKLQYLSVSLIALAILAAVSPVTYAEEEQTSGSNAPMVMLSQEKSSGIKALFKKTVASLKTDTSEESANEEHWVHPIIPAHSGTDSQY